MSARVGIVAVLVQHHIAIIGARQLLRAFHRAVAAQRAIRVDNLRAIQLEHLPPFLRHIVGHDRGKLVALHACDHRQRDARVAAGRLQ